MGPDLDRLKDLSRSLGGRHVGVVGDLIADVYLFARPSRLSREAPVLVVRYQDEKVIPGSAANTAMNAAALGGKVHVVGAVGEDGPGRAILEAFQGAGLDPSGVVTVPGTGTVTKTRILVGDPGRTPQQVIRVDREPGGEPLEDLEDLLLERIEEMDVLVEGWLVSDYEFGLVSPKIAGRILRSAGEGKTVVVDSRHRLGFFVGADSLCPNLEELSEYLGRPLETRDQVLQGGKEVLERLGARVLFLTMGNQGMAVFTPGGEPVFLPVVGPDEVTDVSGAGDTVAATILLARCSGADPVEAGWLATCAASVVVQKLGAATATPPELRKALRKAKPFLGESPGGKEKKK